MEAKLLADGSLIVAATSDLESFALRQWESARKSGKARLVIDHEGVEHQAWESIKQFNETLAKLGPRALSYAAWVNAGSPMPEKADEKVEEHS